MLCFHLLLFICLSPLAATPDSLCSDPLTQGQGGRPTRKGTGGDSNGSKVGKTPKGRKRAKHHVARLSAVQTDSG
ncbi:hypothetical protein LQ764DRAFT_233259 [Zygosaccharomyces rouxii]|nr:hypothetical protein LQ764DRAFT_233259 [Zygosaccharomyces rouxii]